MKVLFLTGSNIPSPSGCWPRLEASSRLLARGGNEVVLTGATSRLPSRVLSNNVTMLRVFPHIRVRQVTMVQLVISMFNFLSSVVVSLCLIACLRPDKIVVEAVIPVEPLLGGCLACGILHREYVVDYQDPWEAYLTSTTKSPRAGALIGHFMAFVKGLYGSARSVVVVTPGFAKEMLSRGVENVTYIPNGADVKLFRPRDKMELRKELGLPEDSFIIVYSGLIGIYYRLDTVIEAMRIASSGIRNLRLVMVGTGPSFEMKRVRDLARDLGMESRITIFGSTNDRSFLSRLLAAGDLGIVPLDRRAVWDTVYPVKLFEYASCGLPILATATAGSELARLIKENDIGLVRPRLDARDLAEAIVEMHDDRAHYHEMSRNSRALTESRFDLSRNLMGFREILGLSGPSTS